MTQFGRHATVDLARPGPAVSPARQHIGRHHSEIHTQEWTIQVIDDLPWFIPPPWIDPQRQPLRNTLHAAAAQTTRLAQQLWLDTGPPDR